MSDVKTFPVYSLIKTNVILSFLSLLGTLTVIILYLCKKNLRSFVFKLVFYLSISELINSVGNIMSINKLTTEFNQTVCDIQSVILTFTDICSLIWMCIISYTIHNLMVKFSPNYKNKKLIFIVIGFLVPLIYTIIQAVFYFSDGKPARTNMVVQDCWCWIYDMEDNWGVVVAIYITYWILILYNFVIIWKVISFLKKNIEQEDKNSKKIRKMINKLYLYPALTSLCFLFATIHRSYQIFYILNDNYSKTNDSYRIEIILYLFHGIFMTIRGFLFFLVYGCDQKVKGEFKKLFSWVCIKMFRRYPFADSNSQLKLLANNESGMLYA